LFDVLVQIGENTEALTKAASWIGSWRKVSIHRASGTEAPAVRLIRMMMAVDEGAARRLICGVQRGEASANTEPSTQDGTCEIAVPDGEVEDGVAAGAVTSIEPAGEFGRRRRR